VILLRPAFRFLAAFAGGLIFVLLLAPGVYAQGDPPPGGVDREAMWYAPTAKDWQKPCLIQWQRTWTDALAVSVETGKPILVCVNMDGEIASEHYAGVRYRQPQITELYAPYVTVIASVYRHTPRDFDDQGQRIECPRFGGVTCGEHIAIETILYEQFFDGKRVAPRHIMVELDGAEVYDIMYAWDTDSVFQAIEDGIAQRERQPKPETRGDRTVLERIASHDSHDREIVESTYLKGDATVRKNMLRAAIKDGQAEQIGLLRLAVFDLDLELNQMARQALAQSPSTKSVDLIVEALRVPLATKERDDLISALARLGKDSPRARALAVVHTGLSNQSEILDTSAWNNALQGSEYPAPEEWRVVEARLQQITAESANRTPTADNQLALALASLAFAVDPNTSQILSADPRNASKYARLNFEDARRSALEAQQLGADDWSLHAVLALANYSLGDTTTAHQQAELAVRQLPPGETSWNAMAVLDLYAESRRQAIRKAALARQDWPAAWLTELHAAYAVLAQHPLGTEVQVMTHVDFLNSLGAKGQAGRALQAGLRKFPDSWDLHARLRDQVLRERGLEQLESVYESMLAQADAPINLPWFAGYASIVTAEYHRQANRPTEAGQAYDRAIMRYLQSIKQNPDTKQSSSTYLALAHAGLARLALERADFEAAVEQLIASFDRQPEAAATLDGLNLSAIATSTTVMARLKEGGLQTLALRLQAALEKLPPAMFEKPDFEKPPSDG
jgi:tetratricopeptide (TPR) repeat protein